VKRTIDIIGALIGLIVFFPVFLIITVIIKMTSPGPVIFKQQRLGKNLRPFTFYKFRSMHHNCDTTIHQSYMQQFIKGNINSDYYKLIGDNRITPFGKFLRKSSLDELPQFWNVLKGDMSLVGPRPVIGYEVNNYKPDYFKRFDVLPGITGLWQINGRSQVSFDESIKMDLVYIDKQSIWFDIKILFKTVIVVIGGTGAD
jgi:lipopolysaccharide/colanic/teichoic acid biosynthesis glycosyltransferase